MRLCTECGLKWPASHFSPAERNPDGSVKRLMSQCKACRNAKARAKRGVPAIRPDGWLLPDRKRCTVCGEWKHTTRDFYVRERWADGSVRSVHAYCKPCEKATVASRQRDNPKRREYLRRYVAENIARERERKRRYAAQRRAAERSKKESQVDVVVLRLEQAGWEVERVMSRLGGTLKLVCRRGDEEQIVQVGWRGAGVARQVVADRRDG